MFAVNMSTQETLWSATADASDVIYGAGGGELTHPVYDDGIVYVGTHRSFFGAFDAFTGALIWKFNQNSFSWLTEPLIVGDSIIVTSRGSDPWEGRHAEVVYAWNKKTGDEVWTFQTGGQNYGSSAYGGGNVYFGS